MTQHDRYMWIRDRLWENGRTEAFIQNLGGGIEGVEIPISYPTTGSGHAYVLITEDGPREYLFGAYDTENEDEDEGVCLVLQVHPELRLHGLFLEEVVADRIHGFLARLGQ